MHAPARGEEMAYREELKNRINEFIESQTGNICVSLFDLKEQDGFSIDGDRRVLRPA